MRSPAVLVIQIIGVLPNVESQQGLKIPGQAGNDASDGITSVRLLGNDECAIRLCGEPNPAAAEQSNTFGLEFCFEGVDIPPLFNNLGKKMPG